MFLPFVHSSVFSITQGLDFIRKDICPSATTEMLDWVLNTPLYAEKLKFGLFAVSN